MATKVSGNGDLKKVQAAWKATHNTWVKTEHSLAALIAANRELLRSLGKAGVGAAKKLGKEFDVQIGALEKAGKNARKEFDKLVKHHTPAAAPKAKAKPAAVRRTKR